MELHHIRYFCTLAKELNYTSAAEKCFVSRQALRQSVQRLEAEYRVQLIDNERNRLSLTPAGHVFLEGAERILAECDALDRRLRGLAAEERPFRLGVSISLLPFYAPEVMTALSRLRETPQIIPLELQTATSESLLQDLREDKLDAAILVDMGCLKDGWCRTVLREDAVCISFSVQHPFAQRESLHIEDLDALTMVLMSDPSVFFRPLYERARALPHGLNYEIVPECFEAFHRIRHEDAVGLDRDGEELSTALDLEMNLPLADFPHKLETVLLGKNPPTEGLLKLSKYLKKS